MQACPPSSSSSGSSSSGEDDAHVMALSRQNTVPVGSVAVDPTTGLPVFVFTSGYQQQQPLVVNYPSTQQFYQNGTTKSRYSRSQKRNNGAKLPRAVVSVCSSASSSPYGCINKGSSNYAPSANPLGCFTPFPGIVTFPQNDPTMWIRAAPQSSVWSGSTHLVHPQPAPRRHSRHLHPPQVPPAVSALETEYQAVASTSTKKPTKRKTKGSFGFVEKAQTTDGTAAARAEPEKSETRKKPACSLPSLPSPSQTELMPPPKINKTVNGDVKNSKIVTSSQHCSPAEHTAIPQKDSSKKRCSDMNPENAGSTKQNPELISRKEPPQPDQSSSMRLRGNYKNTLRLPQRNLRAVEKDHHQQQQTRQTSVNQHNSENRKPVERSHDNSTRKRIPSGWDVITPSPSHSRRRSRSRSKSIGRRSKSRSREKTKRGSSPRRHKGPTSRSPTRREDISVHKIISSHGGAPLHSAPERGRQQQEQQQHRDVRAETRQTPSINSEEKKEVVVVVPCAPVFTSTFPSSVESIPEKYTAKSVRPEFCCGAADEAPENSVSESTSALIQEDPIINNSQEIPSGDLSPDSAESDISNPHQTTSARPIQQHAEVSSELNGKPSPPHQVSSQIVITTPQPQPQPAPLEVPPPLPASPSPPPRQSEAIIINITSPAPPDLSPVLSPSNKDASSSGSSSSVSSTGDPSRLPNEIDAEMKEVSPMEPLRSADATENNTWRTDASTPRLPSCAAVVPDLSNPVGTFGQEKRETAGVSASSEEMLQQQVPPSQAEEATEDEAVAAPLFDILQQFLESQTVMDQAIEQSGPFHPLPLIATNPEGVEEQEPIRNGSSEVPPAQQSGVLPHSFQPPAIFSQYAYGGYPPETNGFAGGDSQQLAHSPSFNADPAAFPSQNLDPTQEVNQLPNSYSGNSVFTQSCAAPLAGTTDPSNHLGVMPMPSPACVTHPFLNDTSPLDPLISSLSDFMFPARPIVDKAAFLRDLISSLEKDSASAWERRDFSHQIVLDVSCQLLKGRYLAERYTLLCTETNAVLVTLSVRANNKEKAAPSQAPPASSGSVQQPPHESPLLLGPPLGAGVDFDDSIPFDNIPLAHQPYQQQYAVQVFAPPTNTQPQIPQPPTPLPVPLIQQQQPPAAPPPQPQQQQLPAVLSTRRLRRKMERLCIWHGMQLKYMETMLIPPQRWTPYGIPPLPTTQFPHCCFTVDDNHVKELWQWVRLCRAMLESEPSENTPSRQSPGDSSNS